MSFSVRFWGVRGSIACSGPRTARYGGNTSSLEVRCGDRVLLFDAGTGMRYLGNAMDSSGPVEAIEADVFLTHTHYDHVCGIPFFRPFFRPSRPAVTICLITGLGACSRLRDCLYIVSRIS